MQKKLHPSLLLVLDIDEALDTKELRLEIDRCYSYLGTPVVRTHARAAGEDEPCNTVRLMVRLGTHRYWQAGDADADALWHNVMESWLYNQFYKLDNHLKIFNRRQREEGTCELAFAWLEVDMENGACIVRFRLDSESGIPAAESAWLDTVRTAAGSGALGEGVCAVELPSAASYAAQREAGLAAKAEREAAEAAASAAEEAKAEAAASAAEEAADAAFLESPALAAQAALRAEVENDPLTQARLTQIQAESDTQKSAEEIVAQRIAEEEHLPEELERKYALPEPDFPIDYTMWTVRYADGSERDYDAAAQAFAGKQEVAQ